MDVKAVLQFVPALKQKFPDRSLTLWFIVALRIDVEDVKRVGHRARRLKIADRLIMFDRRRMSATEEQLWQANVKARRSRNQRELFDAAAEKELTVFLAAHEGIIDMRGWQNMALLACPLLRQHGYTVRELSRKLVTLENQAVRRVR